VEQPLPLVVVGYLSPRFQVLSSRLCERKCLLHRFAKRLHILQGYTPIQTRFTPLVYGFQIFKQEVLAREAIEKNYYNYLLAAIGSVITSRGSYKISLSMYQ